MIKLEGEQRHPTFVPGPLPTDKLRGFALQSVFWICFQDATKFGLPIWIATGYQSVRHIESRFQQSLELKLGNFF